MITGTDYLRLFSVMITDCETNFPDLQANDFGNLGKNHFGDIIVGNHAVIFTDMNSPIYFSVGSVCVDNGKHEQGDVRGACEVRRGTSSIHFPSRSALVPIISVPNS